MGTSLDWTSEILGGVSTGNSVGLSLALALFSGHIFHRNDTQGVRPGYRVIFSNNGDNILPDGDEIWMRDGHTFTAGKFKHKGLETVGETFANTLKIHTG